MLVDYYLAELESGRDEKVMIPQGARFCARPIQLRQRRLRLCDRSIEQSFFSVVSTKQTKTSSWAKSKDLASHQYSITRHVAGFFGSLRMTSRVFEALAVNSEG